MSEIRTIKEPSIYLVGRQEIDDAELDRFLSDEGVEGWETDTDIAAQKLVEIGGRLCYRSYARPRPGGNAAYLGHILEVGHGSVLEHAVFNFIITGVSRSFTHELVRHRAGFGYSQLSQRFVDESDVPFVVPPGLADEVKAAKEFIRRHFFQGDIKASHVLGLIVLDKKQGPNYALSSVTEAEDVGLKWLAHMEHAQDTYADLSNYLYIRAIDGSYPQDNVHTQERAKEWTRNFQRQGSGDIVTSLRKKAREAARSVLPNATETQIFVTGNARALRHFIEMRGSEQADAEIRRVAVAMLKVLAREAGNLFGDYVLTPDNSGDVSVSTKFEKV